MSLLTVLQQIPDKRRKQGRMYQLEYILLFSIVAILCGSKGYSDISTFISTKFKVLKSVFKVSWKKPPSKSLIHWIVSNVDEKSLEAGFRSFSLNLIKDKGETKPSLVLSVDGKSLRGSYDNFEDKSAMNLLSMFDTNSEIILAHMDIPNKESEMVAVCELMEEFRLNGVCYTLDALHTQKKQLAQLEKIRTIV